MMRVREVSDTSTLSELTMFLYTSFQEQERIQVEEILVNREKVLKDEIEILRHVLENEVKEERDLVAVEKQEVEKLTKNVMELEEKMKTQFDDFEKEGHLRKSMFEDEVKKLRDDYEKELKIERNFVAVEKLEVEKLIKSVMELEEKIKNQFDDFEKDGHLREKMFEDEVKKLRDNYEKELEIERDFVVVEKLEVEKLTNSVMELEENIKTQFDDFAKEGHLRKNMFEDEAKKLRDNYEKELKIERDLVGREKHEVEKLTKSVIELEEKMKTQFDDFEKEGHLRKKIFEDEAKKLRDDYEKDLKIGSDLVSREKHEVEKLTKNVMELEENIKTQFDDFEKEGHLRKNMFEDEVKKLRNNYEKDLKIERDLVSREKQEVENLINGRIEFEEKKKEQFDTLKKEGDLRQKIYEDELKKIRDNYGKELKRERGVMEKKLSLAYIEKMEVEDKMGKQSEMFENERETMQKNLKAEVEKLRNYHKKELEREIDLMGKKLSFTVLEKLILEEEIRKSRIEFEDMVKEVKEERDIMENTFKAELEKSRENYEKELECERNLKAELEILRDYHKIELEREIHYMRKKLSCTALEKLTLEEEVKKSRLEFEDKLKGHCEMVKELKEERVKMENILKAELEKSRENYEELERKRVVSENKLILADLEKMDLVEELRKSKVNFEQRLEALEGKNCDLHKELELYKESFCSIMEFVEHKKGIYDLAIRGNVRANGDLSNCYHAGDVSMCKSSGKASNVEGSLIKCHISFGGPSSKTPSQTEKKGTQGDLIGVQLGEKSGCSFLENVAKDGCYNENNLRCKRRRIDGNKYDEDNHIVEENTERFLESGRYRMSLANGFLRKVDSVGPDISEANPLPSFSSASASINPITEISGTDENSKLHCTKLVSGAVDGSSAHIKGDSHVVSYENNEVADLQTGKENISEMLSALTNAPELCMAAVVALYRRHISAGNPSNRGILTGVDIVSATAVARYLVKDDLANKISRSLLEVQQNCPHVLQTCEKLAIKYQEQLLEIYQQKLDPIFCSKPQSHEFLPV